MREIFSLDKPILILGAGGHAAVLLDILVSQKCDILGVVSPSIDSKRRASFNYKHYEDDSEIEKFDPKEIYLVNGIGSLPGNNIRASIQEKFLNLGYIFSNVVSNDAIISPSVTLGTGVQVMSGAILQAGTIVNNGSIVNTGAIVDHDCIIGCNNHIAPGVTLSGHVTTGNSVHIGTGANVIQNINIGDNVVIGAGATITKSVGSDSKVFGFRSQAILS